MTSEEKVLEGNELIAVFMGARRNDVTITLAFGTPPNAGIFSKKNWIVKDLQYHSSWDWLHPVIEKIKTLKGEQFFDNTYEDFRQSQMQVLSMRICVDIDHAFAYVVEFIKWYNSQIA